MKFCPNCGAQTADESKFCMECGHKFAVSAPVAPAAPAPEMNYAPVQPAPQSYAPVQPEAPQSFAPQSYAPVQPEAPQSFAPQSYAPAQPEAPQSFAPQSYAPAQPEAPQSFAPQSYAPVQPEAPQSFAPQGYAPVQPEAPQSFAPQGYAPAQPEAPQSFAPQGYAPMQPEAPQSYAAPAAPQKPKKGMKKGLLFGIIGAVAAIVVAVLLIVLLGGGGASADDPALGLYEGVSCESMGIDLGADGEWVELKAKNKATIAILGAEFEGKWALDGETLTITMTGMDYEGTLTNNNTIVIDFYGMLYTFAKEGAAAAPANTPAPAVDAQPSVEDGGDTAVEAEPEAGIPAFSPITINWSDFVIVVQGAEHFLDSDGKDAIRIYYDFTNNSAESTSPWMEVDFYVTQDGYEAEYTYAAWQDDVPEYGNDSLALRPGCSNRCIEEFSMKLDGGAVVVEMSPSWSDGEPVTFSLDPQNLPGRPSPDFVIPTVADPQWISDWVDTGIVDDQYSVYIDTAETTTGYEGETLLRVYFEFTNNSEEATAFGWALTPSAYQDGVELEIGYANDDVVEDDNYYTEVAPGATIRCAQLWVLRTESPIEIEVPNFFTDGGVGCRFSFN